MPVPDALHATRILLQSFIVWTISFARRKMESFDLWSRRGDLVQVISAESRGAQRHNISI